MRRAFLLRALFCPFSLIYDILHTRTTDPTDDQSHAITTNSIENWNCKGVLKIRYVGFLNNDFFAWNDCRSKKMKKNLYLNSNRKFNEAIHNIYIKFEVNDGSYCFSVTFICVCVIIIIMSRHNMQLMCGFYTLHMKLETSVHK